MASKPERTRFTPRLISLAVASCFATGTAYAQLPTGAHSMTGIAGINTVGSTMTVTTNASRSIVNWQTFSIGSGATVAIQQPGASSANLNRVVGSGGAIDPSVILGALQSNGRVFLLNPAGIVFGAGAQVDVAGLVASTLRLSDTDFLANRLRFTDGAGAGSVVNNARPTTDFPNAGINAREGGSVYLVGASVTNNGLITTPRGEVVLAAGNSVELVNPGTPNLRVEITAPDNEARNLGSIVAEAGRIGIYAGLISHSGTTRADSAVATEDGRIVLKATKNTTIEAGSILSASGSSGGQVTVQSGDTTLVSGAISATGSAGKGGTVQVLGNVVALDGNASIDVSGETGGGTALVGGDFRGKNPSVQNAFRTYFGPNAKISADAIGNGDGGTVIVWSDNATRAHGTISARGGSESGNGGFVEVSSRGWLDFHAKVDTRAPKGRTGTLLLDPTDVCIYNSFTGSGACGEGASLFEWSGGMGSIQTMLGSNNVMITTSGMGFGSGNIDVVHDSPDLASSNNLLLLADANVNVDGRIWNTGSGELGIIAGWNGNATSPGVNQGVGDINVRQNIDMRGNTLLRAGNNINVADSKKVDIQASNDSSRSLTVHAGNAVTMTNALLRVDLSGGEGGSASIKVLAGAGGVSVNGTEPSSGWSMYARGGSGDTGIPGGMATIQVGTQEQPVTGPINLTNAWIRSQGGYGDNTNGGDAKVEFVGGSITANSSNIYSYAGAAGGSTLGIGGSGLLQMASAGNIDIWDSYLSANGNRGDSGGGSGQFTASAAGNINVQNSRIGAEGHSGSFARVLMGANGSISIGSMSEITAFGDTSSMQANGTAAQVTVIGNSILINGFSIMGAEGAMGSVNGGAASMNLIAAAGQAAAGMNGNFDPAAFTPAGPITIGDSVNGPAAFLVSAGDGPTRGGDAALTILAGGPLAVTDSFGVVNGGFGDGASSAGGNSTLVMGSNTAGVNLTRSHFGSFGGGGGMTGGSAVSIVAAGGGDLVIDGSGGSGPLSFFSHGGSASAPGGIGGTAETNTFSTGMTKVTSDFVDARGGDASQGRGGDGNFFGIAGGGFEMLNAVVGPSGGFGSQQGGNALLKIAADTFRLESTGASTMSPSTLVSYGGSTGTSGTPGSAAAELLVLSPTGSVDLFNEKVDVAGGRQGSGASAPYGPGNILLSFTRRTSGGFSVNGVEGAITGSPVGFFVNEQPAIPGTNFFTEYEGAPLSLSLPPFLQQVVNALNETLADLIPSTEETAPTKEEKDKKKKETVCRG